MDSTTIGTNTKNVTMPQLESIPIGTKTPDPTPLKQPTESSKLKGKAHVPEYPESYPSLSDSSSIKYDLSVDSKYRKSKSKGRNKNKKHQKSMKQDSSDSS